jgi:hypothetical protein
MKDYVHAKVEEIIDRLYGEAARLRYGSTGVTLKIHDGQIVGVEYTTAQITKRHEQGAEKNEH